MLTVQSYKLTADALNGLGIPNDTLWQHCPTDCPYGTDPDTLEAYTKCDRNAANNPNDNTDRLSVHSPNGAARCLY